jgi:glycosyltransferase involved in cell wall biosynthesis
MPEYQSDPLVSVILCNFNYGAYIKEAIDSVLTQSYEHFELIVVDDGSTDDSRSIITSYDDHRLVKVFKPNEGQASAFNEGINVATGKYVAFLDSDDFWAPDKLRKVVQIFSQFPECALVQHPMEIVDRCSEPQGIEHPNIEFPEESNFLKAYFSRNHTDFFSATSGLTAPKELLLKIFPIDPNWRICADVLFSRPLPLFGNVYSINERLGYYRVHQHNNWMGGENQQRIDENSQLYVNYTNEWLRDNGHTKRIRYKKSIPHVRWARNQCSKSDPMWYWFTLVLTAKKTGGAIQSWWHPTRLKSN